MTTKEKMMNYVKKIHPDAVFVWQDGTDIFWYEGKYGAELQFYPSVTARDSDYGCDNLYSCYMRDGKCSVVYDF